MKNPDRDVRTIAHRIATQLLESELGLDEVKALGREDETHHAVAKANAVAGIVVAAFCLDEIPLSLRVKVVDIIDKASPRPEAKGHIEWFLNVRNAVADLIIEGGQF